jgi:hypothetical protein
MKVALSRNALAATACTLLADRAEPYRSSAPDVR